MRMLGGFLEIALQLVDLFRGIYMAFVAALP
jgi:hypothetical protein